MTNKKFTPEELDIIRINPYVVSVTAAKITYSLAFKKFAVEQAKNGLKATEIFRQAGLAPEIIGDSRMKSALKAFKKEAKSPEGLHEPRGKSRDERLAKFAKEDFERKHTKVAIRELQKKVVHLEQEIEFLKKIQLPKQ